MKKNASSEIVKNRKAFHDYEILESFEAGLVLSGTEIKSIRNNGASLQEAYVQPLKGELWLIGSHIAPYSHGNIHNHEERRDRKLLMHRREILKLKQAAQEKGLTLIPLALYFKKGVVKLSLGLCKGKKNFDKRESIKERDEKRRMDAAKKMHE
ncbi:SsrA-binding protein SmpB [Criblamydia sequanensis]|uniref:SsrA-binding protein n=1 Tax=Candidatus Criblamydia sequanensis CRIB-18 TaxID=1437425 RepID=A0A090D1M6_9BACT|nr:SsrA-binding protein SmpB [Criblamydia sequanensis]CDR33920.1 SsrA-binding protein [Criblamydia sequanensis CRIB-18]